MKNLILAFIVAVALAAGHSASAKTINPPAQSIERAIALATDYVKAHKIDVSHHFLAVVEYRNLHDEYQKPCWRLQWRLLAGANDGEIIVFVHPDNSVTQTQGE